MCFWFKHLHRDLPFWLWSAAAAAVKAVTVTTECDAEMGKRYSSIMKIRLDIFEWPMQLDQACTHIR